MSALTVNARNIELMGCGRASLNGWPGNRGTAASLERRNAGGTVGRLTGRKDGHEHPRGRRSCTLAVRDSRAENLPTPVSFGGLEIGEEVIAKPSTYLTLAGAVQDSLDPRGQGLACPTSSEAVALQAVPGQAQFVPLGFPVVDGGPTSGAFGLIHEAILCPYKYLDKGCEHVFNVRTPNQGETMSQAKNQPATPLPHSIRDPQKGNSPQQENPTRIAIHNEELFENVGCIYVKCGDIAKAKQDAAYYVHAANAYPKLVEALRDVREAMYGVMNPVGGDAKCAEIMRIDNLLRDLGETE